MPSATASDDLISGINVIVLFIFAVCIMDGVVDMFLVEPARVVGLALLAFLIALLLLALSAAAFWKAGARAALTIAIANGNRNMGLIAAAMVGSVPELTWIFLALAQFPIYLFPLMMEPFSRRLAQPD